MPPVDSCKPMRPTWTRLKARNIGNNKSAWEVERNVSCGTGCKILVHEGSAKDADLERTKPPVNHAGSDLGFLLSRTLSVSVSWSMCFPFALGFTKSAQREQVDCN